MRKKLEGFRQEDLSSREIIDAREHHEKVSVDERLKPLEVDIAASRTMNDLTRLKKEIALPLVPKLEEVVANTKSVFLTEADFSDIFSDIVGRQETNDAFLSRLGDEIEGRFGAGVSFGGDAFL